jgi:hypothetical protein
MIKGMPTVSLGGNDALDALANLHLDMSQGSWTWFEIVLLPGSGSDEPKRTKDGREMAWRSHANQTAHDDRTMHYGLMFD